MSDSETAIQNRIRDKARYRVHAWLRHQLGLPGSYCRVADLDDEQCREALRLIERRSYPRIRVWAKGLPQIGGGE